MTQRCAVTRRLPARMPGTIPLRPAGPVVALVCSNPACGKPFTRQSGNALATRPCCSRRCFYAIAKTIAQELHARRKATP